MSNLIDAMIIHIHHLVHDEQRPFSYLDFMKFEVDDHELKVTHGTFRNIISRLVQEGLVEVSYKSNITIYTLKGLKFDKTIEASMTDDHTGGFLSCHQHHYCPYSCIELSEATIG